jgi:hypothetical protein
MGGQIACFSVFGGEIMITGRLTKTAALFLGCFALSGSALAQPAPSNPRSISGCVKQIQLGILFPRICKYIEVGDRRYSVIVRSELVFQEVAEAFPNIRPVPTDKEVTVYGINSPGPSLNCYFSGLGVVGRYTTRWEYKPGGRSCQYVEGVVERSVGRVSDCNGGCR